VKYLGGQTEKIEEIIVDEAKAKPKK